MSLSQSRRAVEARQWRIGLREKRRFNTLVSDFISVKYPDIYDESCQFYKSLNKRYPKKHNLTKTRECKRWKGEIVNDQSSESEEDNTTEPNEEIVSEATAATTESFDSGEIVSEATAATTESFDSGEIVSEATAATTEPVDSGEIAFEATGPTQNIVQAAAEGLIPDNLENIDDIDNVIDNIIMDLQQDDVLRDYLNAERNGELLRPLYEEEDEGIGLNVDTELEAVIEPFDFELDMEGFDF